MKLFIQSLLVMSLGIIPAGVSASSVMKSDVETEATQPVSRDNLSKIHSRLSDGFKELRKQVVKEPNGFIKYPYLIPAGFYSQLWDWDAFFMANHFISKGEPEYMNHSCICLDFNFSCRPDEYQLHIRRV